MSWDMAKLISEKSFNVIMPDFTFKMTDKKRDPLFVFNLNQNLHDGPLGDTILQDESIYIKRKVNELNTKKAGKGDTWLKEWNTSRTYFIPIFIEGYEASASKPYMPKLLTSTNETTQTNLKIVLQPIQTHPFMAATVLLMHADIVTDKEPYDTVARINFCTFYSSNLSKKYPGELPAAFYMAGEMIAKFFNKYIYKPK